MRSCPFSSAMPLSQERNVSAASFLDAPCTLWVDTPSDGSTPVGTDGGTWRDWLIDALVTLAENGEGFSGKRPNCDAGWHLLLLADALDKHGTTFAEAVGAAFGVDHDERDRPLLTPNWAQAEGIGHLISALAADVESVDQTKASGWPHPTVHNDTPGTEGCGTVRGGIRRASWHPANPACLLR